MKLNLTLKLTDGVNKSKREIKTHLLKQQCHFILLLQVFELFYRDSCLMDSYPSALHHMCNAVPGALQSKFTMLEKPEMPNIWSWL